MRGCDNISCTISGSELVESFSKIIAMPSSSQCGQDDPTSFAIIACISSCIRVICSSSLDMLLFEGYFTSI